MLPSVSLKKDEIQCFKTRVGPFVYGISGGERRELVALKINLTGEAHQRVVVQGQAGGWDETPNRRRGLGHRSHICS